MHWALRSACLFFGAILIQLGAIWCISTIGRFNFALNFTFMEGVQTVPIFSIAILYSVYSLMLPPTHWAMNGGRWGEHDGVEIFFLTSLFLAPLFVALPSPSDPDLAAIAMSRTEYLIPFFVVWWFQGAINVIHVRLIRKVARESEI